MEKLRAERTDRDEDRQCVEHARSSARSVMAGGSPADSAGNEPEDPGVDADAERGRLLTRCKAGEDAACKRLGLARRSAVLAAEARGPADAGAAQQPTTKPAASTAELPVTKPEYVPPKADFPESVAGFKFGSTAGDVVKACKAGGATPYLLRPNGEEFKVAQTVDGDVITCDGRPPADPFAGVNVVERVFIHFCRERTDKVPLACRVDFDFAQHDVRAAITLAEKLEAKYGPITPFPPAFECRTKSGRDAAFTGSWFWLVEFKGDRLPAGHLMLNYACTPVVHSPEIFLVYRDMVATYREFVSRRHADF